MPFRVSLDRFEGNRKRTAVLIADDGTPINFPKVLLPKGSKAGDILTVTIERDQAATTELVERTKAVQDQIKKIDTGGDLKL
jgi:hypothetical protein